MTQGIVVPEDRAELREALEVGRKFVDACFSAWSCGEPMHRVRTMLDRADEFQAALNKLDDAALTPAPPAAPEAEDVVEFVATVLWVDAQNRLRTAGHGASHGPLPKGRTDIRDQAREVLKDPRVTATLPGQPS